MGLIAEFQLSGVKADGSSETESVRGLAAGEAAIADEDVEVEAEAGEAD